LKTLFRYIAAILSFIAAAALLLTYVAAYISPARFWPLGFFSLAYPVILAINGLFILYWFFNKPKIALLLIVVVFLGFNHLRNFFQIGGKETDQKGIVVCSYNVKHFSGITKGVNWIENSKRIQNFLRSKNADIVCLQELSNPLMNKFNPFVTESGAPDPRMNSTRPGQKTGPAIFSIHPIISKGEIVFDNTENMIVYADITIDQDTIRVYSCHLQSYQFTDDEINSIDDLSIEDQEKNIRGMRAIGYKMKKALIKRTAHAVKLKESIRKSPYPVIVCGDFNDPPGSFTYRTVRSDLKDAFVESGSGIGNSYLGKLPSLRIDYILYSKDYRGYGFQVGQVAYSDHYPISCKLIRKPS